MNNLFSIFAADSWAGVALNWIALLIIICVVPAPFWTFKNGVTQTLKSMIKTVMEDFKAISSVSAASPSMLISLSLLLSIAMFNSTSLLPFTFTASAHLVCGVSLALPLWGGHLILTTMTNPRMNAGHLVPLGTPPMLIMFMVLIELISNLIRPLTLSVRLTANLIAGHLLLTLITANAPTMASSTVVLIMVGTILLCVLECGVAMIQAYVFSVLSTLYVNEADFPATRI